MTEIVTGRLVPCSRTTDANNFVHYWTSAFTPEDSTPRTLCDSPVATLNDKAKGVCPVCKRQAGRIGVHLRHVDVRKRTVLPFSTPKAPSVEEATLGSLRECLRTARKRAKGKGWTFDIDWDWLLERFYEQKGRCALTGLALNGQPGVFTRNPFAPSIDRADSMLGYTPENSRLVCCATNLALNEWGESIFADMARGYIDLHSDSVCTATAVQKEEPIFG